MLSLQGHMIQGQSIRPDHCTDYYVFRAKLDRARPIYMYLSSFSTPISQMGQNPECPLNYHITFIILVSTLGPLGHKGLAVSTPPNAAPLGCNGASFGKHHDYC